LSVSVIIPTRNEEKNIVKIINGIREYVEDCTILVVDDSDDNRTKLLALINDAIVVDGQHKGLGQAIIDGLKVSESDISVVMDADLSHPVEKLPELINACQDGYEMAVGSRYVKGGSIRGWTLKRRIISLVASLLAYPISSIRDNTSGYFACKSDVLDKGEIKADSWKIMLEVLVKTGAKVKEVPIEFKDREAGKSKFNRKEVSAYLKHLVKLAFHKWRILPFMIVGGIGYIVNMAVYYPLTLLFKETVTFLGQEFYLPPFIISSYVAITSNYLLNKLFTFKGYQEKKAGYLKYLATCSASLPVEMVLIYLFVHFMGFEPIAAVAVAILIVFIARFTVVKNIVWRKNK
jgi:dolichol-phosphate mannosyltransferase